MKKIVMFIFNGDPMCFIHVLLNALNMFESDYETKIVIEGTATKLISELAEDENPMHGLWNKTVTLGLVDGVCKACSNRMGTLDAAKAQGLTLLDEMSGHPSIARYRDDGFEVLIF